MVPTINFVHCINAMIIFHLTAEHEQNENDAAQSFNPPQAVNGFWRKKGRVRRETEEGGRGEREAGLN